jgi:leucyl-tRNA synthetase
MDTFVESSWYFARFTCPDHETSPLNKNKVSYWLPVDQYVGGIEHAVLHLLYARFFTKVLRDLGIIEVDEPFINLLTQGMVCKESFRCHEHGWLYPEEVKEGRCTHCGKEIIIGRVEKMSKSVKNVVDPEFLIEKYGADTARIFCLFAAPPERDLEWSDKGVEGCFRFLNRLWRAIIENKEKFINIKTFDGDLPLSGNIKNLRRKTHLTIKKVTLDIEEHFHFNTAISSIMELLNMIYQFEISKTNDNLILSVLKEAFEAIILLLYPMVPHICEELWDRLGNPPGIMNVPWPSYDDEIIKAEKVTIVIQINGKVRSRILVPLHAKEEEIKEAAFSDPKVKEWIKSKEVKKTILIPQKLLSIVVK